MVSMRPMAPVLPYKSSVAAAFADPFLPLFFAVCVSWRGSSCTKSVVSALGFGVDEEDS